MISIDQSNYFATKSIYVLYEIDFTLETISILMENLNSRSAFLSAKKLWFLQTKVNYLLTFYNIDSDIKFYIKSNN